MGLPAEIRGGRGGRIDQPTPLEVRGSFLALAQYEGIDAIRHFLALDAPPSYAGLVEYEWGLFIQREVYVRDPALLRIALKLPENPAVYGLYRFGLSVKRTDFRPPRT